MIEYEREYLCWKKRQLALRRKYADTPPGLTAEQAREEERQLLCAEKDYEERKRFRLTTAVQLSEEPFVGRREALAAIKALFAGGAGAVFLSGMGGIGKSALARAYGRVCSGEYDQVLLWIYDKSLEQIFIDDGQLGISNLIYTKNRYPSRRQYAQEKYARLQQIAASQRLLIILDNCNRTEDPWFARFMALPCDLLVTTRLSRELLCEKGYRAISVGSMEAEEEWREFYRIYAGKEPEGQELESIKTYRESVMGHTLKMKLALCNPAQRWSPERFAKSILSNFRLKKGEIQVLCELSFITLLGIPREVYLDCTESSRESLEMLKSYSLVQEQKGSGGRMFLSLHPVIAEAVRTTWNPDETRCLSFLQEFTFYIRHSWNRPRGEDLWLKPQVFAILQRLPEPVPWRFFLYECLATYLLEWEYFRESEQMERQLYECVRGYYGETHQYTAQMAMRVAAVCHNQMKFEESVRWYELGYGLYREAKPVNREYWADRAEACEKLARVYEHRKEYGTAFRYTEEALEAAWRFRQDAEKAAPRIWMVKRMRIQYVYLRRARLYFGQGDTAAAARDLETALNLYPLNSFQQIEFRMLQIRIWLLEGEYQRAREAADLNLVVTVYYQGESFKDSLSCREQMGDVLRSQGEFQAANEYYVRVIAWLQEKYPHQEAWVERLQQKMGE